MWYVQRMDRYSAVKYNEIRSVAASYMDPGILRLRQLWQAESDHTVQLEGEIPKLVQSKSVGRQEHTCGLGKIHQYSWRPNSWVGLNQDVSIAVHTLIGVKKIIRKTWSREKGTPDNRLHCPKGTKSGRKRNKILVEMEQKNAVHPKEVQCSKSTEND